MVAVIIEPENLSRMTILPQPIPFDAHKNLWRCLFPGWPSCALVSVPAPAAAAALQDQLTGGRLSRSHNAAEGRSPALFLGLSLSHRVCGHGNMALPDRWLAFPGLIRIVIEPSNKAIRPRTRTRRVHVKRTFHLNRNPTTNEADVPPQNSR
jgi:hypothetical protein